MRKGMEKLGVEIALPQAQRMCLEKKRFDSKNQARDWGINIAKKFGCALQHAYRCELCKKYHVSQIPNHEKPAMRKTRKHSKEITLDQRNLHIRAKKHVNPPS